MFLDSLGCRSTGVSKYTFLQSPHYCTHYIRYLLLLVLSCITDHFIDQSRCIDRCPPNRPLCLIGAHHDPCMGCPGTCGIASRAPRMHGMLILYFFLSPRQSSSHRLPVPLPCGSFTSSSFSIVHDLFFLSSSPAMPHTQYAGRGRTIFLNRFCVYPLFFLKKNEGCNPHC